MSLIFTHTSNITYLNIVYYQCGAECVNYQY